jgi:hypothetical protein
VFRRASRSMESVTAVSARAPSSAEPRRGRGPSGARADGRLDSCVEIVTQAEELP